MAAGTQMVLLPGANSYPASNPATPGLKNNVPVLLFDAAADEEAHWTQLAPQSLGSGTLTAYVAYTMASATTGNVVLGVSIESIADAEATGADSFDTENTLTDAVPGTAGDLQIAAVTLTNKDAVAAGERVRIKVRRLGTNVSDTATGDLELHGVEIRES